MLYSVSDAGGFTATFLDEGTCAKLRVSSTIAGELFVKTSASPEVYHATEGALRYVPTMTRLVALAGVPEPRILTVSAAAFSAFTIGEPYTIPVDELHQFSIGQFIVSANSPKVWLPTRDGRLLYLPNWDIARAMGLPASAQRVSDDALVGYDKSGVLGWFVTCDGSTSFVNEGMRYPATGGDGFASVRLDASLCDLVPASREDLRPIFVKTASDPAVFHLVDGARRYVPTMLKLTELNGGTSPVILTVLDAVVHGYPAGEQYFVTGSMRNPRTPLLCICSTGRVSTTFPNLVGLMHWVFRQQYEP